MALVIIVADGTNPDANSYIDAQFADDYANSIGSDVWCDNASKQSLALIQSARFLDLRYGQRFKGIPLDPEQILQYPRRFKPVGCTTQHEPAIPRALKYAQAHLAIQFLEDGALDLNANATQNVISTSVSVGNGAVAETIQYAKPVQESYFSVADGYIAQLHQSFSSAIVPILRG